MRGVIIASSIFALLGGCGGSDDGVSNNAPPTAADVVVSDMKLKNDFLLRGYEAFAYGWYVGPGFNVMGNDPSFKNTPVWSIYYNHPLYVGVVANSVLPWVAFFDGVDHAASNIAVELENICSYIKSRSTGKWSLLSDQGSFEGGYYPKPATELPVLDEIVLRGTKISSVVKVHENSGYFWHGWSNKGKQDFNPADIDALFVTARARLVVADAARVDDRDKAQIGMHVGADYYVDKYHKYTDYAPAVGISRVKTIRNDWQSFNFMTFSDVGEQDPGGGITEHAFRIAPPPIVTAE